MKKWGIVIACILITCIILTHHLFKQESLLGNNINIDDLSLEIYCISPYILTDIPMSVNDLKNYSNKTKLVVNGQDIYTFIDAISKKQEHFIEVEKNSSYINARMYYVLKNNKNDKLLEVVMWGGDGEERSMFLNGKEIKEDKFWYEVIIPFLPEEVANEWENVE